MAQTLFVTPRYITAKEIKNVRHIMFRAFGREEHPDYTMYMEFLESRCFPRSRDKMKLILKIDALFLNEDRHTHNIAVLMNEDVRKRVENILYTQMSKYQYLFVTDWYIVTYRTKSAT